MGNDFGELQSIVENTDNLAKKNNIKLQGLKEGAEGESSLFRGDILSLFGC